MQLGLFFSIRGPHFVFATHVGVDAAHHLRLLVLGVKELTLLLGNQVFGVSLELLHDLETQVGVVLDGFIHLLQTGLEVALLLLLLQLHRIDSLLLEHYMLV